MLVVMCLRQMVTERAEEGPAIISVRSKHQRASLKKTAEEKAFALYGRVTAVYCVWNITLCIGLDGLCWHNFENNR